MLDSYERDFNINKHLLRSPTTRNYIVEGRELIKIDGGRIAYVMIDDNAISLEKFKQNYRDDIKQFLKISIEISVAFSNMHDQNVIHLDIKPQNILITPEGHVKLMDFGVSQVVSMKQPSVPFSGNPVGTYAYMSPEATGRFSRHIDFSADIYSTGMTFYRMLNGEPAFVGQNIELVHAHIAKNPTPIHTIHTEIPEQISEIIQKCLEKKPEDRFSSMAALSRALEYCYNCLNEDKPLNSFNLSNFVDIGVFSIPDKLYGREKEINYLKELLFKTINSTKLSMIAGYSGCGKTALVTELNRILVSDEFINEFGNDFKAIYASGKYNQFQNQPYEGIIQIMSQLLYQLTLMDKDEFDSFKVEIIKQTKGNLALLNKVLPSLESVLGPQPQVETLGRASEAEERFASTVIGFLQSFGIKDKILLFLFLDDLQWSDTSSLQILEGLVAKSGSKIFLVGAYRDNEVDSAHPLIQTIDHMETNNLYVDKITLESLKLEDVNNLISDTLRVDSEETKELSNEIFNKTQGNAFFTRELFLNLYSEKLVRYSLEDSKWLWDLNEIRTQNFSENVVDFMVKNFEKFEPEVQNLLSVASCIGSSFSIRELSTALDLSVDKISELAYTPICEGWIQEKNNNIKWQHDRLQQASYVRMNEEKRQETHLQLGMRLWNESLQNDTLDSSLFDIVNHFLLVDNTKFTEEEINRLISLYIKASEIAIDASAFAPSLSFAKKAVELLGDNPFANNYDLAFQAHLLLARAHYVNSNYEDSEEAFNKTLENSEEKLQKLRVLLALNEMYYVTSQFEKSFTLMLEMYQISKIFKDVPLEDPQEILKFSFEKYGQIVKLLEERGDTPLSEIALENDEEVYLTNAISANCIASVFLAANSIPVHFLSLSLVNLEGFLKYGKNKFTSSILGLATWVVTLFFKNVALGQKFLETADIVLNEFKSENSIGKLILYKAQVTSYMPDFNHATKNGREYCDRSFIILNSVGDYSFAGFAAQHGTTHHFRFGTNIHKQLERHKKCVAFYRKTKWANTEDLDSSTISALKVVAGIEPEYNPKYIQENFTNARLSRMHHNYYHAWALYFQRKYVEAFEAASKAQAYLEDAFGLNQFNDFFTLMILILTQMYSIVPEEKKSEIIAGIEGCKKYIDEFDAAYIAFFKPYKAFVEAEILRIKEPENVSKICNAYDEAIRLGDEMGNFWITGYSNELCGEYLIKCGFDNSKFASIYIHNAIGIWESIGASIKTKQLYDLYPKYAIRQTVKQNTVPNASNNQAIDKSFASDRSVASVSEGSDSGLDTETIIKATQALSKEIDLSKLLEQLMNIVMENAGATSGALILKSHDDKYYIEACSWKIISRVEIDVNDTEKDVGVCVKIVKSVFSTKNSITYPNIQKDNTFKNDVHIRNYKTLSLFCTPIINKNEILGVLYLENNKIESVFHHGRSSVIHHLMSSVSANVENARNVKNIMELNTSYERFLPREFLRLLNKGDVRNIVNGDNVTHNCSVSFLDIRNFTGITENLSSSGSMHFVNQFLEYICPEIENNQGFIDKFIGDAVMSLYPKQSINGLFGVVGMIHALERLNADHYQNKDKLKIGIGLHYGILQLGTVGYANRMDGTAIGDVVNTASRLESLTKGFGVNIIISQDFFDQLIKEGNNDFGTIQFCKLGDFILKGRTKPTSLYEVYDTTWKDDVSPREHLKQILELFISRRFKECQELCNKLIKENPENHFILDFYSETAGLYDKYEVADDWDGSISLTKDGTSKTPEYPLKIVESANLLNNADYEELERYRRIFGKLNSKKASNYCIQWNPIKKKYEKVDLSTNIDVQKSE